MRNIITSMNVIDLAPELLPRAEDGLEARATLPVAQKGIIFRLCRNQNSLSNKTLRDHHANS